MLRLIIIAGLFICGTSYGSETSDSRDRINTILDCSGKLQNLDSARLTAADRLKNMSDRLNTIVHIFGKEEVSRQMGIAVSQVYRQMIDTASAITNPDQGWSMTTINAELGMIDGFVSRALKQDEPKQPTFSSAGKKAMETRFFEEDWSDLAAKPEPPVEKKNWDGSWDFDNPWDQSTRRPER